MVGMDLFAKVYILPWPVTVVIGLLFLGIMALVWFAKNRR